MKTSPRTVDWNSENERAHFDKHGITFADAAQVFLDVHRLEYVDDRRDYGETRFISVGRVEVLFVTIVFTMLADGAWIISARRASRKERANYVADQSI